MCLAVLKRLLCEKLYSPHCLSGYSGHYLGCKSWMNLCETCLDTRFHMKRVDGCHISFLLASVVIEEIRFWRYVCSGDELQGKEAFRYFKLQSMTEVVPPLVVQICSVVWGIIPKVSDYSLCGHSLQQLCEPSLSLETLLCGLTGRDLWGSVMDSE